MTANAWVALMGATPRSRGGWASDNDVLANLALGDLADTLTPMAGRAKCLWSLLGLIASISAFALASWLVTLL